MICPNCNRPYSSREGFTTSDPREARKVLTYRCTGCGREATQTWEFGRLVRDDVTHHGRKA